MRFGVRYAVVEAILVGQVEKVAIAVYWLLWCPAPSLDGASSRVPNKVGRGTGTITSICRIKRSCDIR